MPLYDYKNPQTGEIKEVSQSINDEHIFIDEHGLQWDRVYTTFLIGVDTKIDPFSQRQFVDKTNSVGTMGDIWDRSAELSQKRAEKNGGVDPIKEKYKKEYSKKRGGREIIE